MSKKDISNVITKGSAKQRALLMFNAIANDISDKGKVITEKEYNSLLDSFKTDSEIKLYNKFRGADRVVRNGLSLLHQLYTGHKEQIAYISGYGFLWDAYQRTEELLNEMLSNVDNKKTREKLLQIASNERHYFLARVKVDEEGFIDINTEAPDKGGYSIELVVQRFKDSATISLSQVKTVIKALNDFMKETGFNIRAYKEAIKEVEQEAKEDKAIFPKYSRSQAEARGLINLPQKYFIYPSYEEAEIDEAFYNEIREKYLSL